MPDEKPVVIPPTPVVPAAPVTPATPDTSALDAANARAAKAEADLKAITDTKAAEKVAADAAKAAKDGKLGDALKASLELAKDQKTKLDAYAKIESDRVDAAFKLLSEESQAKLKIVQGKISTADFEALIKAEVQTAEEIPLEDDDDMAKFRLNAPGPGAGGNKTGIPKEAQQLINNMGYKMQNLPAMHAEWHPKAGSSIGLPIFEVKDRMSHLMKGVKMTSENDPKK